MQEELSKELDNCDNRLSPDTLSKAKACLDEFNALPEGTKNELARAEENLPKLVSDVRRLLVHYPVEKITVLNLVNGFGSLIGHGKRLLLLGRQTALEEKMRGTDVCVEVLADVEEMTTELSSLAIQSQKFAEKQERIIEECEALLDWKNVQLLHDDRLGRNLVIQSVKNRLVVIANVHTDLSFGNVAANVADSLYLRMLSLRHDNGLQENKALQNWLELTKSLASEDISNVQKSRNALGGLLQKTVTMDEAGDAARDEAKEPGEEQSRLAQLASQMQHQLEKRNFSVVADLEKKMRKAKIKAEAKAEVEASQRTFAKKWSREERSLLSQLAGEVQSQLEKFLRTCETSMKEYEKLARMGMDDQVMPLLQALADASAAAIRSNGRIVQFCSYALQEQEDNESFLPSDRQTQRQQSQAPLPLPENMYETADGIVVGQIKQEGKLNKLERLGIKGEVTGTYFKDDSGRWIRDYGSEPALEELAAAAITGPSTGRDKAVKLMEKAGRITDASLRSSAQARAKVELINASDDEYMTRLDKKIEALKRASSRHSAVINQLADIVGDLTVLPAQEQETPEEDPKAVVLGHLSRLKEDRRGVESLLQHIKNEQQIHARKMRDPTEADFRFPWKEGQVASIKKDFSRRQNRAAGRETDWLERYTLFMKPGTQGTQYEPWIVHAHFDSGAAGAEPVCVHMKRHAEKDWGADQKPYHSLPLHSRTFDLVKKEAQKEEVPQQQVVSKKGKGRRRH